MSRKPLSEVIVQGDAPLDRARPASRTPFTTERSLQRIGTAAYSMEGVPSTKARSPLGEVSPRPRGIRFVSEEGSPAHTSEAGRDPESLELSSRGRLETKSLPGNLASPLGLGRTRSMLSSPESAPAGVYSDEGYQEDFADFDKPTRLQPEKSKWEKRGASESSSSSSSAPTVPPSEPDESKSRSGSWKRAWRRIALYTVSASLLAAAVVLRFVKTSGTLLYFEWWRWLFLAGSLAPIYDLCTVAMRLLLLLLQSSFFAYKGLLFFVLNIQGWLACTARIGLSVSVFAGLFSAHQEVPTAYSFFWTVLRVGICLLLASIAQVAKILLAKTLSTQFYKTSYFDKMQDALRKEYFLVALSQKRPQEVRPVHSGATSFSFVQRQHSKFKDSAGTFANRIRAASQIFAHKQSALERRQQEANEGPESDELLGSARRGGIASFRREEEEGEEGEQQEGMEGGQGSREEGRQAEGREEVEGGGPGGADGRQGDRAGLGVQRDALDDVLDEEEAQLSELRARTISSDSPALPRGRPTGLMRSRAMKRMLIPQDIELPQRETSEHKADPSFHLRLHRAETHLRKQTLRTSIVERLGVAHGLDADSHDAHARKMAFHLFLNLKGSAKRQHVTLEDLQFFLPDERAAEAFAYFDVDGNGKISIEDLWESISRLYEARKNLAASLGDTKSVVGNLERIVGICIHLVFVLFYLAIFQVALTQIWLTVSSMLLSFVFVFGNSIRGVYESVVFLFVVRPYDVGDLLLVGPTLDACTVSEIALLNTVFTKWDGHRVLVPNTKLATDSIVNVTRSGNKGETFKVAVDVNRLGREPMLVEEVQEAVSAHVKAHPLDFTGDSSTTATLGPDPYKATLVVWWSFKYNGSNARIGPARTGLLVAISRVLERHHSARQPLFTQAPLAFAAEMASARPALSRSSSNPLRRSP